MTIDPTPPGIHPTDAMLLLLSDVRSDADAASLVAELREKGQLFRKNSLVRCGCTCNFKYKHGLLPYFVGQLAANIDSQHNEIQVKSSLEP